MLLTLFMSQSVILCCSYGQVRFSLTTFSTIIPPASGDRWSRAFVKSSSQHPFNPISSNFPGGGVYPSSFPARENPPATLEQYMLWKRVVRFVWNCGPEGSKIKGNLGIEVLKFRKITIWKGLGSSRDAFFWIRIRFWWQFPSNLRAKWSKMGSSSLQVASKMDHKEGKKGD